MTDEEKEKYRKMESAAIGDIMMDNEKFYAMIEEDRKFLAELFLSKVMPGIKLLKHAMESKN